MSPQELGRYQIVREVGRGAMGVVYLAEDPRLHRRVAIKTVELTLDDEQQRDFLRNRLLRDAQAAASLSHPNIVPVFDVIEEPDSAYVVMEYVDGESLAARLRRTGRPEPAFTLRVLREMSAALDYTHARGVIHRDIKPGNVMLDAAGVAKIMDFGIARIADTRTNTPTGMVMGTIHYMAPEQIKGEALDGRCDQFALGAVAYEMLTGGTMFGAQSLATLAYKIVNEEPPPMRSLNGDLPEAVDVVIRKALAKQPAQRFASCGEFVRTLDAAFAGQPLAIETPDREAPTRSMGIPGGALAQAAAASAAMPARRPGRAWILVAAVGTALAAGAAAMALWKPWTRPHPPPVAVAPATVAHAEPGGTAANALPAPAVPPEKTSAARNLGPAVHTAAPQREVAERAPDPVTAAPKTPRQQAAPEPEPAPIATAVEMEQETQSDERTAGPAVEAWKQGNALESQGDHAGAIAAYTKAISIKPRYAAAFHNRGLARFRDKDFANAAADFSHAIDILPKNAKSYVWRGNARSQLKQMDLALSDYSRAIELNPELPGGWGGRGAVYVHESQFRKALNDLNQAVRLAPHQEIWYRNRAAARRGLGDEAGARADEDQAKRLMARRGGDGAALNHRP
ncbi:MAG TPA: protein kinase [Bryobacteraceae bacterium]|nr:protein kinase [Bryobacteraceae bacterium]